MMFWHRSKTWNIYQSNNLGNHFKNLAQTVPILQRCNTGGFQRVQASTHADIFFIYIEGKQVSLSEGELNFFQCFSFRLRHPEYDECHCESTHNHVDGERPCDNSSSRSTRIITNAIQILSNKEGKGIKSQNLHCSIPRASLQSLWPTKQRTS